MLSRLLPALMVMAAAAPSPPPPAAAPAPAGAAALAPAGAAALAPSAGNKEWDEPFPPHRIADNLYYVGTKGLASYLITTGKGHIIINSGFERTVPLIRKSVEQLGFKLTDVKILLASHAHNDHVEGMGLLKQLTGAAVYVMRGDDKVIASGGDGQYNYPGGWRACPVSRVLEDGDKVTLAETTLVARRTPGHTRGCTTWTLQAKDGEKRYAVVVVGSPNVNPGYQLVDNAAYPEIAADYVKGFAVLKSLPCDIFLGAHGNYYGMLAKHARLAAGGANPFVDPEGYKAFVAEKEKAFADKLAEQKKARPSEKH
jgi:metallo-beta-lactamase class B